MTIEEAVAEIVGAEDAPRMTAALGIRWTVVWAMVVATTADNPVAIARVRRWVQEQKAEQEGRAHGEC